MIFATGLLGEVVGVVAVVVGVVTILDVGRRHLSKKLDQIHVLVNSRLTEALSRIDQLAAALEHAGIPVPDDPAPSPRLK